MITIEKCLDVCDNQFDLVVMAANRARQISHGAKPVVSAGSDKPTVVALNEISQGYTDFDDAEEDLI